MRSGYGRVFYNHDSPCSLPIGSYVNGIGSLSSQKSQITIIRILTNDEKRNPLTKVL